MRFLLRRIGIYIIILVFVCIGIWMMTSVELHETKGTVMSVVLGSLSILFFGGGGLMLLYRDIRSWMTHDKYLLFTDEALVIAGEAVPWDTIQGFQLLKISGADIVGVVLKDPEAVINRCHKPWKRWLMEVNYRYFGIVYSIAVSNTNYTKDELLDYCCRELIWQQAE